MFAKHTSLALVGLNLFYREMIQTGSGIFVETLEDALGQTMAYLWAVEEERVESRYVVPPFSGESLRKSYRSRCEYTQTSVLLPFK